VEPGLAGEPGPGGVDALDEKRGILPLSDPVGGAAQVHRAGMSPEGVRVARSLLSPAPHGEPAGLRRVDLHNTFAPQSTIRIVDRRDDLPVAHDLDAVDRLRRLPGDRDGNGGNAAGYVERRVARALAFDPQVERRPVGDESASLAQSGEPDTIGKV